MEVDQVNPCSSCRGGDDKWIIVSCCRLEKKLEAIQKNTSLVHFYFKELGVVNYSRDELYGTMDLVGRWCPYCTVDPKAEWHFTTHEEQPFVESNFLRTCFKGRLEMSLQFQRHQPLTFWCVLISLANLNANNSPSSLEISLTSLK